MTKSEYLLVRAVNGIGVLGFNLHVVSLVAGGHRQPWVLLAESGIYVSIPLHGSSFAVAADFFRPARASLRILHVFLAFGIVVLHANFFAVIHDGRAAQREIESTHHARDGVVVFAVAVAIVGADLVVVADDVDGPAARGVNGRDLAAKFRRRQLVDGGEHEVHRHLQFVIVFAVVLLEFVDVAGPGLADQNRVAFVGDLAKLFENIVNFGKLLVVEILFVRIAKFVCARKNGIVAKVGNFEQGVNSIEAKARHAALVPPASH